jgi:hypothetical protein
VTAEIIIKTHVLMIDCIRNEFEISSDPETLVEMEKNPLETTDELYGVPAIYSILMRQIKDRVIEQYEQNMDLDISGGRQVDPYSLHKIMALSSIENADEESVTAAESIL